MVKYEVLFGNRKSMYIVNSLRTHVSDYLIVISGQWLNDVTKLPFSRFGIFYVGLPQGNICNDTLAGTITL